MSKTIRPILLEARGFEPLTLGLQSRCSSQLSHAPDLTQAYIGKAKGTENQSLRPLGAFCLQDLHLLADGLGCAFGCEGQRLPFFAERR